MKKLTLILLLIPSLVWGDGLFVSAIRTSHFFENYIPNEEHHAIGYEWGNFEAGIVDRNSQRETSGFIAYKKQLAKKLFSLDTGFRIGAASGYVDSVQPAGPSQDKDGDGLEEVDGHFLGIQVQPSLYASKTISGFSIEGHASPYVFAVVLKLNL